MKMTQVRVLMVEDSEDQQTLYQDAVDDHNAKDTEKAISIDFAKTGSEAIDKLTQNNYDATFLDLILEGDDPDGSNASGNDVLSHIIDNQSLRLIVYVVSGTLHSLSTKFDDVFENPLMRKFDRSEETETVLNDLIRVMDTGVTRILGGAGQLESLINNIFFNHLSHGFDRWVEKNKDCEKELLRYTTMHLLEYLDTPDADTGSECRYFNPEFYIYPPIREHAATGDIIKIDEQLYTLLSPSCDITPRKIGEELKFNVNLAVLAQIIPLNKDYFDQNEIPYSTSGKITQKAWNSFEQGHRNSSPKQRFHYLPEYLSIAESLIDFKALKSMPLTDVISAERVATISSPFIRDVQSRFSAYFGRQGQPAGDWSI